MDNATKSSRPLNNRKGANLLSVVTFAFTIPTFLKGLKRELFEEDIPEHLENHDSKVLGDRLERSWKRELALPKNPSLWRAVCRSFGPEFVNLGLFVLFIELVLKLSQPLALSQLIKFYTRDEDTITQDQAYLYAGLIVCSVFLSVLCDHGYLLCLQHFGMKLRVACCSIIYRKSLKLSKSALGGTTVGQMVNLLSNDVNRCDNAILHAHNLFITPIQTIVVVVILYYLLGWSSTIGVLFIAMFIPLQMYLGKKTSSFRLNTALKTDERIRLMNEILSGIQIIKMYAWEKPFAKLVGFVRRLEISHIRGTYYVRGLILSFTIFTTRFSIFLTILTYVLLGKVPDAEYVFVLISFYDILKKSMTSWFPKGIAEVAELNISITRLQTFLLHDEVTTIDNNKFTHFQNEDSKIGVNLSNVSAKWQFNTVEDTLSKINFQAESGQLIAVVGPVGSGKTSLLNVILKELPLIEGNMCIEGRISYASQEPWIFAATIQQNILFGQPLNLKRYYEVINVCALDQDLSLLPYGDQTLVGERGVTLSGGQKARVSLARAIYKEADIYLFDDPLSAVDTHVGKQLFDECISKYLKTKCTILVTHQLQYLKDVYQIYLMENGKITISGTYEDMQQSNNEFATSQFTKTIKNTGTLDDPEEVIPQMEEVPLYSINKNSVQLQVKEQRSFGTIASDVYLSYCKAAGSLLVGIGISFLFISTQVSASVIDYFLSFWVNLEEEKFKQPDNLSTETCIYIYTGISVTLIVITLLRSFCFFSYCMKASINLHDNMFRNIVKAPMRFFNINTSGRILNRFSKDMGAIDEIFPVVAIDCIQIALNVIGVTVVVSLVNPWLLIVTFIMLFIFYVLRVVYIKTSRSVKRLEGITRSPVFTHMSASLQGLTTIRAFGAQNILQKEFDDHQDFHSSVWYMFLACSRAFGFWLDGICSMYIAFVTFSFFFIQTDQHGGNVGLAITQAISLTGMFQWGMRQWAELENQMTSVERIKEFVALEGEINPTSVIPSPNWPEYGAIDFVDMFLSYAPLDPYVLKNLNFSIKPKEKIGIVGRTGAGKSSLIYGLFQLAKTEGMILIDNIDISKIPLNNLRSKISIIPQEPVLFSGTLRKNLDPFHEYNDADLWKALQEVELKGVVLELPLGLNSSMSEGGSNFSVGQRQLLCLARAIIRKNRILILDEATANVDPQTDALIQNTIRKKFLDCTVLTIAHRLHTIMDSCKVLVMDAGSAVEFGHPHLLLQNRNGMLYNMVQKTGQSMAEVLMKVAENSYRHNV